MESGGKWMIKKYVSGKVVEKSKFWVPEQTKRRSKKNASSSRKRDENDRNAVKQLARIINCNFSHGDLWLTLNYSDKGLKTLCEACPGRENGEMEELKDAADHELDNFLRRMRREMKKLGIDLRAVALTSDIDGDSGKTARLHHHIIMPRAAFEICQKQWKLGGVDYQLLRDQPDYTPLAVYLCKQVRRKENQNRWKATRNLLKPVITETETYKEGELHAPRGSRVLSIGKYDEEIGTHYIRYIAPEKSTKAKKALNYHEGGENDGV
ncbi:MAG: hypothetical protein RR394_05160 [Oscillospiraceae bacterium]